MPMGINLRTDLTSSIFTTVASTPTSGKAQILTFSLANRTSNAGTFRLAVVNNGTTTPAAGDYIEYDTPIAARSVFERTGLVLQNGQTLVAYSSIAGTSAVTYGLEDTVANTNTGAFKYNLTPATYTTLTTGPSSGRYQTVTVNFCNTSASTMFIRLNISTTATSPAAADFIEYDVPLAPYSELERSGIVIGNGQQIGAYASAASCNVVAFIVDDLGS